MGGDSTFVPFELREDERLANGDVTARRSDEKWFVSLSQEPEGGVDDKCDPPPRGRLFPPPPCTGPAVGVGTVWQPSRPAICCSK